MTTGMPLAAALPNSEVTASKVLSCRPRPGPITTAWGAFSDSRAWEIVPIEATVSISRSGRFSGINVAGHSARSTAAEGMAT